MYMLATENSTLLLNLYLIYPSLREKIEIFGDYNGLMFFIIFDVNQGYYYHDSIRSFDKDNSVFFVPNNSKKIYCDISRT